MKTLIPLLLLSMLTACSTTGQRTAQNPEGYRDQELILIQQAKLEKIERDMERREQDLKYQHMRELNQIQMQVKNRSSECRFLCF